MIIVDNTPIANPYTETLHKEITDRFFLSLENLIGENKFRSVRNFCMMHNLNYPNVYRMNYSDSNRKPTYEMLFTLHHFYQVNLNWLITGDGEWKTQK